MCCMCCVYGYTEAREALSTTTISSITRVSCPSFHRKLNRAFSAEADTHTQTREFLAGGFGGTGHSFLFPTTPWCFIVSYPRGVTRISDPLFLCAPPPIPLPLLTLTGRRCQWALNVTAQVNLCPAITASIEGCVSTRILN